MINVVNQYVIKPGHISGVGPLLPAPNQPTLRTFEIYLSGGQTLTVKAVAEAASQARDAVVNAADRD